MRQNFIKAGVVICLLSAAILLNISSCSKGTNPTPNQSNNNTGTTTDVTPTITSLSVTSGTFNTLVVINGTNFSTTITDNKVYFNGKVATVTAATATQLTVTAPQDAGTGVVTLTVKGSITAVGPIFTYYPEVKITSIDVNSGAPGTTVKITGSGFSIILSDNKVFFNGKAATVTAATATLLTVTVPDGAGNGAITVSVGGGPATTGPNFSYLNTAALSITSIDVGKCMAGTVVNITGTGFSNNLAENNIFFNGKAATVSTATTTQLTVTVPAGAGCGKITAIVKGITAEGPTFDYYLPSTVSTFAGSIYGFADGPVSSALFGDIADLATDNGGNVYVTDKGNNSVRKITLPGTVSTFAGTGSGYMALDNLGNIFYAISSGTIYKIAPTGGVSFFASGGDVSGLACDKNNNVFVSNNYRNQIFHITPAGAPTGNITVTSPSHLAMAASSGNMYVATPAGTILKINPSGASVIYANETAMGIAVDANENLYITTFNGNVIKFIDHNTGAVSIIAKSSASQTYADGDQFTASFNTTGAIAIDNAGNIYVADQNRIRKITLK